MRSLIFFVVATFIGLSAVAQPALGGDDGSDFLIWQRGFSFAPLETVEFLIEENAASIGKDTLFSFVVTNHNGIVVGLIEAIIPGDNPQDPIRDRGFGFISVDVAATADDKLLINGVEFGDLTASPGTGRFALGFSLLSSQAPGPDGNNVPLGGATVTIVSPDGGTSAANVMLIRSPGRSAD
jgi:hypothetical protein